MSNVAINRSEVSQALAKAIAYKQCGQHDKARAWAIRLVQQLECSEILNSGMLHQQDGWLSLDD